MIAWSHFFGIYTNLKLWTSMTLDGKTEKLSWPFYWNVMDTVRNHEKALGVFFYSIIYNKALLLCLLLGLKAS